MNLNECGKTLLEVLPHEFATYVDERSYRHRGVKVVKGHYQGGWPGTHRNVMVWYELENGMAVGWNESPSRGWSFPCVRLNPRVK